MFTEDKFSYFGDEAENNLEDNDSNGADTGRQEKFDKSGNRVRGIIDYLSYDLRILTHALFILICYLMY